MGPDMDPEYADVGGNRIAYRRVGHGPLIVLVHGAVCDGRVWSRQLLTLADLFTVVAWDAPGCGESSDPPESFRLPEYADALAGLIATLGGGEAHVVGHSFGGALALELARRHPDVVASMTLVGAYAGWAGSLTSDEVQRRLSFALDVAGRLPGGFDPTSMPGLFTPAMDRAVADELAGIMSQIRPAATRAMAHALAEADLRGSLERIDVPVLLLYGDADKRSPLHIAEYLRTHIPGARLVVLSGAGHYLHLEDPAPFEAALRQFLSDVA